MPPIVATIICIFGIVTLLRFDRDRKSRPLAALWLPIIWLLISGSRPLSSWLHLGGTSPAQLLEGSPLDRNIYLGLQISGFLVLLGRRTLMVNRLRANPWILLFVFYCALSISWSDYWDVSFKRWIKLLGDLTMVLIVLTAPNRQYAVKRVFTTVGFVLIPLSVLLIRYYPTLSRYYEPWTGKGYVSGVGSDKNMLGATCMVYGLAAVWRLISAHREKKSRERTRRLVAHSVVLAMAFWLFYSADSMTSLACFMMGCSLIVAPSLLKRARKPMTVHMMVAAIVGVSFSILFLHVGEGAALKSMGRNPTLTGRTEIWTGLLKFSGNPLIGTGFDSFWLGDRLRKVWASGPLLNGINEAHNGYLETYLNLGLIGVSLLAALIATGYRNIISALHQDTELGRLRLALFVVAVVYNFTEAGFRTTATIWIAFLLAITAVPKPAMAKLSRRIDIRRRTLANMETEAGLSIRTA
jgi:exopolysaccharide production protein ExoQ